jgi:hypothetical protein
MNSSLLSIIALLLAVSFISSVNAQAKPVEAPKNEADVLDNIVLHSFEHFDYLDILFKLKGHNSDTWIVLFYKDEDHHKEQRDAVKRLIFGDEKNKNFRYAEANISQPNYAPITQAIRFPQHATEADFPMILIMKDQVGQMVFGPGVARKAADIVLENRLREEQKKLDEQKAATPGKR